ncbi:THO complex protein subunit 2 [Nannizzia gypsea CBS 118893]|uniref:THO complex subunit 2 n=1 Tax=Arthroderma gypseum (strain ATCC MYA-4604 / CBS 118893) TaxID=535722 RepID=E4UT03_ARTGP|nr:THO complex protein subunit 2 [Nannizzia gypsea CBS 118893]EFR00616.1 THO complex protein subunit 2 [Nannizzia gypsea CBS 118893]
MAPVAGNKRKRGDRSWSGDSSNDNPRPSPHRPSNLNLAQQQQQQQGREGYEGRGRGGRRSSRGGRNARRGSDGAHVQQQQQHQQQPQLRESPAPAKPVPTSNSNEAEPAKPNGVPVTQSPAVPAELPQQAVVTRPSSYCYEYISPDSITNWIGTGQPAVIEVGTKARAEGDSLTLSSVFQELVQLALEGRVLPQDLGNTVRAIIGDADTIDSTLDPRSMFLDTLSILTESEPSNPNLRPFIFSTGIPPETMRLQLETPLLQSLGLIRDTFARMGIRKQTNLLYRQSNYNLLREESEGYSKLLTELFTTSNNEPPSSEVVEDTFERVKAMIGAFDMDVGRALDVTLDVFAAVLVKQYRFCVKFLRASSWWPKEGVLEGHNSMSGLPRWALPGSPGWSTADEERAEMLRLNETRDQEFWDRVREIGIRAFFELGRQPISEEEQRKYISAAEGDTVNDSGETKKWIEQTGTLPPRGNRVAAQLLGFKLRYYSSNARNPSDVLPDNLIYLAALLIKVGFISLRDLYPHLWRPDESMDTLKEEKMKEKAEREAASRHGGAVNALMAAGALIDDTLPPPPRIREPDARPATPSRDQDHDQDKTAAPKAEDKEQLPEPADQKVLLLKSLLAIGALPESLYILGKFPWLLDAYPELLEFIHRIIHHCLNKVYNNVRPLAEQDELKTRKKIVSTDQSITLSGKVRLGDQPPRRILRWAQLDKEDTNDGTDYRFYWDDWADNIPICQSVDDVIALCGSFLNLSGVKIGNDPSLLTKLARIGSHNMKNDPSEANASRWKDLCKRLLVPALSLTKVNPGVVNEIFELLQHFPQDVRFSIYAEWNIGQVSRLPDIKSAFDLARAQTKDSLKRLSKTNLRPMARTLAKIAYANPGIVINVAISQIESYENLIEVIVECARYFTFLGYDVLTWALVNSLGQKGRNRMQASGLLASRWLNSLATFAGRVFKRYSSIMNPIPILQYVSDQLRQNNSTDLLVLEQLISSMGGIVTDNSFNDAQLQAMAGGEVLQSQTMLQLLDKRHESKTTSKRLMKSLADSNLAGLLLIAMAQERVTCIFKESESDAELKLLGNIFDETHRVLTQYLDLLRSNFTVDEFNVYVPDVVSLISEFGLQPEVAFWISRPSIAQRVADASKQIQEAAAKKSEPEAPAPVKSPNGDVEMGEDKEGAESAAEQGEEMAVDGQVPSDEAKTSSESTSPDPINPEKPASSASPFNSVVQELMDQMKTSVTESLWEVVGLPFYITFWQLSLYDIYVPQKSYEDETERLKKRVIAISHDRSDMSSAGAQRKEREKRQINELHDQILDENKRHIRAYGQTRARLQKEKGQWFVGMRVKHEALNIALMQQCFLPRTLLSPIDALYSFKMLKYLHSSGTPNFRTVGLLDQLFRDQRLTSIIFQCTAKEADNFGRFLHELLRDLSRWHADKAIYEKEAFGAKRDLPGFARTMDPEGKPTTFLDYEDFRRILYKWHRQLSSSLKTCLSGGEYMHIRNAISILKAVIQYFPAVNWIGRDMQTCVTALTNSDPRDDIKIPSATLVGDLSRREKKWLLPQAFTILNPAATSGEPGNTPKNEAAGQEDKVASGKPRTPQPQSTTSKPLNVNAPEFQPSAATIKTNGTTSGTGRFEVEDGEIEDAKKEESRVTGESIKTKSSSHATPTPTPALQETTTDEAASLHLDESQGAQAPEPTETQVNRSTTPIPNREESRTQDTGNDLSPRTGSAAGTRTPSESSHLSGSSRRIEVDRQGSNNAGFRPPASLPSKPDLPRQYRHSDLRTPGIRPNDPSGDRRDGRDYKYSEHGRLSRYGPHDHERLNDHPSMVEPRGFGRHSEKDMAHRPYPEDHLGRPPHMREPTGPRDQEWRERHSRGRLNPPDNLSQRPDHPRSMRDDVNMQHPHEYPHRPGRPPREDRRPPPHGHSSRPPTPSQQEEQRPSSSRMDRLDDRDNRNMPGRLAPQGPARHDDLPSGPRGARASHGSMSDNRPPQDYQRDGRMGHLPPPDPSYGRLNQDSRFPSGRSGDSFERNPDIPSGPRRNNQSGRGGRVSGAGPHQSNPSANPDRQPPTGPASWTGQRGQSHQDRPSQGTSAQEDSNANINNMDTSGIHPDRLKAMQDPNDQGGRPKASPSQQQNLTPLAPPSGPRGGAHGPPSASPTTRGRPSGGAVTGEGGRGDKRFAGLNNMLQQSSGSPGDKPGQGPMGRGRVSNRQAGSISGPSPQSARSQPPNDTSSAGGSTGKSELFPTRSNGSAPAPEEESRRSGRSNRRNEIIDEASSSRRSPHPSTSGPLPPDRPMERPTERASDRGDRDRERRTGEESSRTRDSKKDDRRDRPRERDRDRDRGRVDEVAELDDARGSRDSSSRRSGHSSAGNTADITPTSSRRRERRERDDARGSASGGGGGSSGAGKGIPLPPPPPPPPPMDRPIDRWGGAGAGPVRSDDRPPRDRGDRDRERGGDRDKERDRGDRGRDRDRDRGRDRRDGPNAGPDGRGPPVTPASSLGGSAGNTGNNTWPRKRGRPHGVGGDESHEHSPSMGGPMRPGPGSDMKRPRR